MALNGSTKDFENKKFVETAGGETAVRVVSDDFVINNPTINVDVTADQIVSFTPAVKAVSNSAPGTLIAAGASNLAGRNQLTFQSDKTIFIGATGVTISTGIKIAKDQIVTVTFKDDTVDLFGIVSGADASVKLWETVTG